ncbi:winged helix-turn-helix domain-containing protein [Vibrio comitans]|uniref:Transcriptional regulator CadC n=1 Tax=Vibrio comitans NBRC 102076 TaxID=1219078 RepID=A0A4Y3INT0_9VIBR|nr:winged helix-turn-helix domain-containing protein [Vibrio comitans]GEA61153.1 transcriptional regulator CadC [Vibrio comitans NBRC 102076]
MDKEYVTYRFDGWVFTPDEDKLNYQGETFTLDNRLSKLLHFFCQNPNTVFSRNELIDEVWNGSILTDQVITQAIFELRKTLKAPNRHAMGYIVTVPKRGYKFEIDHIEQQVDKPKVAAPIRVEKEPTPPVSEAPKTEEPAPEQSPPTAEVQTLESEEKPAPAVVHPSQEQAPKKSPLVYILAIVVFVLAGMLFMQSNQKSEDVAQVQTASDQQEIHYLSLEPRYIFVDLKEGLTEDPFTIGIIRKLLDYLTVYKDYRIVFDENYVPNSANVITFGTVSSGDRKSLEVTYFNRTSSFKHLDRSYVIEPSTALHSTIEVMLDDLLDAFKLDIPKSIIAEQVSELPENQAALHHILESLGFSLTVKYAEAIESVSQAYEISPDNHLVASDKYIFELASIFVTQPPNAKEKVKQLNQEMKSRLMAMESNPESYRVYDALAAYYLSLDEPKRAKEYLEQIPNHHYSLFSTVLYAKIEESSGNTASAEEYYYETIREAGSPAVLDLARKLFFNSNLKDIEAKIHSY